MSRFLRPTSTGYDVFVEGFKVGYLNVLLTSAGGFVAYIEDWTSEPYHLGAYATRLEAAEAVADAHEAEQEDLHAQQLAEIEAEMGYERHLENQMAAEYEAFERYEQSMGLS